MEFEGSAAYIFSNGVQLACPRCPEVEYDFQKEVGGLHHYCLMCGTLYENPQQVIDETRAKEAAQNG